jgi:hypothetical protein
VDKQQEYNIYCTSSNMNILSNSIFGDTYVWR